MSTFKNIFKDNSFSNLYLKMSNFLDAQVEIFQDFFSDMKLDKIIFFHELTVFYLFMLFFKRLVKWAA